MRRVYNAGLISEYSPHNNFVKASSASSFAYSVLVCSCLWTLPATARELWVSPDGNDNNPGIARQPFASVAAAQYEARELRRRAKVAGDEPVKIILHDGIYPLTRPLVLGPEDSGTPTSPTVITAAPGEHPVLSGGVPIGGWKKLTANISGLPEIARGQVWVADAPKIAAGFLEFRQLWANGTKTIRAREPNGENLHRLAGWDKTNQTATIPAAALAGIK